MATNDMATNERDSGDPPAVTDTPGITDPRDTDHPTGSEDAAENAANDPPS